MQKLIYINKYLTSAEFYKTTLPEIQTVMKYYDKISEIIFDFSGTSKIEPNVIPNFLCLGKTISNLFGRKAIIRIPETFEGGKLKNYMYLIGFTKYAKEYYKFESDPYTGFEGKQIDPLCGTICFEKEARKDQIGMKFDEMVGPFAEKYLRGYNHLCLETGQIENNITNLLKELTDNAAKHGESASYTTVHAKYSDRTIYIAISDMGKGFLKSCHSEHKDELEEYRITINNELEAIEYCVYRNIESRIFGLNAIIKDTIAVGGKVRIHSNDTQIILTKRVEQLFIDKTLFKDMGFQKYNVRRNLPLGGTHIEIEIPF